MPDYPDLYIDVDFVGEVIKTRYRDIGQGDPVVLVHGLGACLEVWAKNVEALSANHRLIMFDMPGHGLTAPLTHKQRYNTRFMSLFVSKFIHAMQFDTLPALVGHSVGGLLTSTAVLNEPDLVDKLILISPAGIGKRIGRKFRLATMKPLGELAFSGLGNALARQVGLRRLPQNELISTEFVETLFDYLGHAHTSEAILCSLRAEVNLAGLERPLTTVDLERISLPVLVLWGEADKSVPSIYAIRARNTIKDSQVVILRGAKHRPQVSRADEVNALILSFLQTSVVAQQFTGMLNENGIYYV